MSATPFVSSADHYDERIAPVAELCRRIAVHRYRGETAQARQLEKSTLPTAVEALRAHAGEAVLSDALLEVVRAREWLKVVDAALAAEVSNAVSRFALLPGPQSSLPPATVLPLRPVGSPRIADLLDEMLEQEATARRARQNVA